MSASAAYGVATVKTIPSRHVSQIIIEIPEEHHVAATLAFHGQNLLVTAMREAAMAGVPYGMVNQQAPEQEKTNFGNYIVALYKSGFWNSPKVLKMLGVDPSAGANDAHEALRQALGVAHLSETDPAIIRQWAKDNGVEFCLPEAFKK